MFERFTKGARSVVTGAMEEARELGHDSVGNLHLMLGLLQPEVGAAYVVLNDAGVHAEQVRDLVRRRAPGNGSMTQEDADSLRTVGIDLDVVLEHLAESLGPDAVRPQSQSRRGRPRFSRSAKKTLQVALRETTWLKARAIGSEHLLLGLLRCEDSDVNVLLAEISIKPDDLRKATLQAISQAA